MKRLIILTLLCLPMVARGQDVTFAELVEKYSSLQHCTTIELSKQMLQSMDVHSDIDSLVAISVESDEHIASFRDDVTRVTTGYSTMLSVNNSGELVKIYGRSDNNGHITTLIVVTISSSEGVVVMIKGDDISLSDASSLISL
ncbi:MAG: DUF4252 domain-containing protein [Alistipes sp.]|nr:DUF4252 domain-containing protein [Alistipes sp.]